MVVMVVGNGGGGGAGGGGSGGGCGGRYVSSPLAELLLALLQQVSKIQQPRQKESKKKAEVHYFLELVYQLCLHPFLFQVLTLSESRVDVEYLYCKLHCSIATRTFLSTDSGQISWENCAKRFARSTQKHFAYISNISK